MAKTSKQFICFRCERTFAEMEDAERCEREHEAAHDAWCPCSSCTAERCMPEEMSR